MGFCDDCVAANMNVTEWTGSDTRGLVRTTGGHFFVKIPLTVFPCVGQTTLRNPGFSMVLISDDLYWTLGRAAFQAWQHSSQTGK
jgi:hypothetical protein